MTIDDDAVVGYNWEERRRGREKERVTGFKSWSGRRRSVEVAVWGLPHAKQEPNLVGASLGPSEPCSETNGFTISFIFFLSFFFLLICFIPCIFFSFVPLHSIHLGGKNPRSLGEVGLFGSKQAMVGMERGEEAENMGMRIWETIVDDDDEKLKCRYPRRGMNS